jgi:hypothetical protein
MDHLLVGVSQEPKGRRGERHFTNQVLLASSYLAMLTTWARTVVASPVDWSTTLA